MHMLLSYSLPFPVACALRTTMMVEHRRRWPVEAGGRVIIDGEERLVERAPPWEPVVLRPHRRRQQHLSNHHHEQRPHNSSSPHHGTTLIEFS
jgi:hypothetical protein